MNKVFFGTVLAFGVFVAGCAAGGSQAPQETLATTDQGVTVNGERNADGSIFVRATDGDGRLLLTVSASGDVVEIDSYARAHAPVTFTVPDAAHAKTLAEFEAYAVACTRPPATTSTAGARPQDFVDDLATVYYYLFLN